jgi:hypothetical protein
MVLADQIQELNGVYLTGQTGAYSAETTSTARASIVDAVVNSQNTTFTSVFNMTGSAAKDYQAALFYDTRNKDFNRLQDAVVARTTEEKSTLDTDIQNARRQSQINEWSAYNKLDTLFVTQLTFIALVFLAPLLYLKSLYILPSGVFWGVAILIFIAVLLTIMWRVQYTDKSRSNQFWHRRRFGDYSKTPNTVCV